jgi:hypothetical protein
MACRTARFGASFEVSDEVAVAADFDLEEYVRKALARKLPDEIRSRRGALYRATGPMGDVRSARNLSFYTTTYAARRLYKYVRPKKAKT